MVGAPKITLQWPGKALSRAPTGGRLTPAVCPDAPVTLIEGDNLVALEALQQDAAGFTLAYLDPPFFTGRSHHRVIRQRDPESGQISRSLGRGFDDHWESLEHYLSALAARLSAVHALLTPQGCLVLHVDPKTSHYVKVLCDELFGPECFASEIVWRYRRWPSKQRNFQRVHDVLLRYVKDPKAEPRFQQLYEPLAPSTRATWGEGQQRAVVGADGRRVRSSTLEQPSRGVPLGDVWEIGIVAPVAKERTGYPTQKPEALLTRLIEACTLPGDRVLDPYAGSGTTLAVAARMGRPVVGIDENREALELCAARLRRQGLGVRRSRAVPRSLRPARPTSPARLTG